MTFEHKNDWSLWSYETIAINECFFHPKKSYSEPGMKIAFFTDENLPWDLREMLGDLGFPTTALGHAPSWYWAGRHTARFPPDAKSHWLRRDLGLTRRYLTDILEKINKDVWRNTFLRCRSCFLFFNSHSPHLTSGTTGEHLAMLPSELKPIESQFEGRLLEVVVVTGVSFQWGHMSSSDGHLPTSSTFGGGAKIKKCKIQLAFSSATNSKQSKQSAITFTVATSGQSRPWASLSQQSSWQSQSVECAVGALCIS